MREDFSAGPFTSPRWRRWLNAAWCPAAIMGLLVACSDAPPVVSDPRERVVAAERAENTEKAEDPTRQFDLSIADREVALTGDSIRVTQGERVELRWTTDEGASIHLHGYDIEASLEPGQPVTMSFDAEASGRFPITTHGFAGRPAAGGPRASAQEHDHGEHDHAAPAPAAAESDHSEKTLLYLEVYPR